MFEGVNKNDNFVTESNNELYKCHNVFESVKFRR